MTFKENFTKIEKKKSELNVLKLLLLVFQIWSLTISIILCISIAAEATNVEYLPLAGMLFWGFLLFTYYSKSIEWQPLYAKEVTDFMSAYLEYRESRIDVMNRIYLGQIVTKEEEFFKNPKTTLPKVLQMEYDDVSWGNEEEVGLSDVFEALFL